MKPHKSQTALQNYLDGLLQEAQVELSEETVEQQERPVLLKEPGEQVRILPTLTAPPGVQRQEPLSVEQPPVQPAEQRPDWSGQAFECLLFDVAGLKLAVPLVCLGSIYPLEENDITPIFAQPDWFVGIMPTPAGNLKVLDTARWVMPERYHDKLRDNFRFVISVDGCSWGLAVNAVHESIHLQPDAVKWRKGRAGREWLAGTVIEHMCALLDVQALAKLVGEKESDKESRLPSSSCIISR